MRKDAAGLPLCGSDANMLGVRPSVDIAADPQGYVLPGHGGLSVTPDDPNKLPPHVRPSHLGGRGKLPVFEIPVGRLAASLTYRPDPARPDRHGFVEPAMPALLVEYQKALASTRSSWMAVG
jgi:hypothetical protein